MKKKIFYHDDVVYHGNVVIPKPAAGEARIILRDPSHPERCIMFDRWLPAKLTERSETQVRVTLERPLPLFGDDWWVNLDEWRETSAEPA